MKPPAPGVVLAHPLGNQFVRHLAETLAARGQLAGVCTCIDWRPGALARLLPRGVQAELRRRSYPELPRGRITTHPLRESLRLAAGRAGLTALTRHETGALSVDAVFADFDRWVAGRLPGRADGGLLYAYEDAAATAFAAAERLGWTRAYDLPIAYWETGHRLLAEEAARWPQWERTLEATRNSPAKLARKTRELALADLVVCPSRFVADSLPAAVRADKRVIVAPFGSPRCEPEFYRREYPDFTYEKPRPHAAVLALMATCDVFCLPSIVEGRALVIQEAMSAGLPAIVTAHTGADDAIEPGRSGFVVPIRSPGAIAEKIAWFADRRAALPDFARAAQAAAARFTWHDYGERIAAALATALPLSG